MKSRELAGLNSRVGNSEIRKEALGGSSLSCLHTCILKISHDEAVLAERISPKQELNVCNGRTCRSSGRNEDVYRRYMPKCVKIDEDGQGNDAHRTPCDHDVIFCDYWNFRDG
jgi:hypothetical protein